MRYRGWSYPRPPWKRRLDAKRLLAEHPDRLAAVAGAIVEVLAEGRVGSQRKLRDAVRRLLGSCSDGDVDAAVELLGRCVRRTPGLRGATEYTLNVRALPPDWPALLERKV
jgi:hypothetical protein